MGMLGQSGRPVFKPSVYQPGRHNRRLPRGLGLLLIGIALGAGGVLFLQTNYGPPRLSTEQSEQVRSELNAATLERQRLQTQIEDLQRQVEASHAAAATAAQPAPPVAPQPASAAPAAPEPAPAAAAAASPQAAPAPAAAQTSEAASTPSASPAPRAAEEPAAPEAPKPVARRPVHHDYEEPHSQLRMTIIPMTAPTPSPSK